MSRVNGLTAASRRSSATLALGLAWSGSVLGQYTEPMKAKVGGSPGIHVLSHIPLGGYFRVMDNEIEQEPGRPYSYVSQSHERAGFSIIDMSDLTRIKRIYSWKIENPELHGGTGGMDGKYFKIKGKYYYLQSLQFGNSGPDADLGAVIADVTGLPDTTKIRIVARIRDKAYLGGFHNTFAYKHSDGRSLLFVTVGGPHANVYDLERIVSGAPESTWMIAKVPIPSNPNTAYGNYGYHDFYLGFDPATQQDKFYGAGRGGYFIYDVSKIGSEEPKLITSIVGAAGVTGGHTFTPSPDGKFAITESEYQYAPLRVFDLRPGLEGKVQTISEPVGAWTADWHTLSHNHEVRWPYVFVSAYEDGLQVFNMEDPKNPYTMAWYYTCMCPHQTGFGGLPQWNGESVMNGAFGVKVRNYDGLIVISDSRSGFWAFKMDGFEGWRGEDWAMPNITSAQDWDHGPPGVKGKVTSMKNDRKTVGR